MSGTNIVIGGSNGGGGSGDGTASPSTPSSLANSARMVFNDFLTNTPSHVPLLPYALIASSFVVLNEGSDNATSKAKSLLVFASNSAAVANNPGVSVITPYSFGFSLGKGSCTRTIVKFFNPDTLSGQVRFHAGFMKTDPSVTANTTISGHGVRFHIAGTNLLCQSKSEGGSTITVSTTPFARYNEWLVFDIVYLDDITVEFTVWNLDTKEVIHTVTYSDAANVPNWSNNPSGGGCKYATLFGLAQTAVPVYTRLCAYDYAGFGELDLP